jgi:hypothetical protein
MKFKNQTTEKKQFAIYIVSEEYEVENQSPYLPTPQIRTSIEVCIGASCERVDIMEEAIVEIVKSLNFNNADMKYLIGLLKKEIK